MPSNGWEKLRVITPFILIILTVITAQAKSTLMDVEKDVDLVRITVNEIQLSLSKHIQDPQIHHVLKERFNAMVLADINLRGDLFAHLNDKEIHQSIYDKYKLIEEYLKQR